MSLYSQHILKIEKKRNWSEVYIYDLEKSSRDPSRILRDGVKSKSGTGGNSIIKFGTKNMLVSLITFTDLKKRI